MPARNEWHKGHNIAFFFLRNALKPYNREYLKGKLSNLFLFNRLPKLQSIYFWFKKELSLILIWIDCTWLQKTLFIYVKFICLTKWQQRIWYYFDRGFEIECGNIYKSLMFDFSDNILAFKLLDSLFWSTIEMIL